MNKSPESNPERRWPRGIDLGMIWRGKDDQNDGTSSWGNNAPDNPRGRVGRRINHKGIPGFDDGDYIVGLERLGEQLSVDGFKR